MGIITNLLFGDNSNNTSYKDAAYKKRFQDISNATYDSMYGGMTDYLDKNYEGGSSKFKYDFLGGLKDDADKTLQGYKQSRYNTFGNGIIGSLLNPIAQTASSVGDLTGMALSGGKVNAWDSSKDPIGAHRDWLSDLGALGETALTVVPAVKGLRVAKAGKAVNAANAAGKVIEPGTKLAKQAALWSKSQAPKTIGQKIAGGALMGAGYGASGSLRDMGSENFDPGQFALSTAIGGGVGGGMAGLGGLWNKYTQPKTSSSMANVPLSDSKELAVYSGPKATTEKYQDALRVLNENGIDLTSPEAMDKTFKKASIKLHPDKNGGVDMGFKNLNDAKQLIYDDDSGKMLQNILRASKGSRAGTTATAASIPKQSFGQKLSNLKTNLGDTKAGNKVANQLKTRKGKIIAGAGGGLLLSQLMRGNNSNSGELSDDELAELYNYIYGGGQ